VWDSCRKYNNVFHFHRDDELELGGGASDATALAGTAPL
jgi:hypothetical protein